MVKFEPTTPNMSQHVATEWPIDCLTGLYIWRAFSHAPNSHTCSAPLPPPIPTMLDTCTRYFSSGVGGGGRQRVLKRITVFFENSEN